MHLFRKLLVPAFLTALVACRAPVTPKTFKGSTDDLYRFAKREYDRRKWENAVGGFERLTLELPVRDTLLPRSHYYLGMSHLGRKEYLLAAQAFSRLAESFPDDTLADDAYYQSGRAYQRMWRRPDLDAQYGETALGTYQTLLAAYPDSPVAADARKQVATLEQWFATKDYDNGMHYLRRKAYDSAILYFKGVTVRYPQTPRARDAYLRLVEAYRAIRYTEDARETCATLHRTYPGDRDVRAHCGPGPQVSDSAPTPVP